MEKQLLKPHGSPIILQLFAYLFLLHLLRKLFKKIMQMSPVTSIEKCTVSIAHNTNSGLFSVERGPFSSSLQVDGTVSERQLQMV